VEPTEDFALPEFARAAQAAVDDITSRHRQPLLVAGTGLYLRALTDPMEIPGTWPEVKADLEVRVHAEGPARLHAELADLDPLAASRMEPANVRRIVRALEVVVGSGRPFSSFGAGIGTYGDTPYRMIGLRWTREKLHERIALRVQRMIDHGLLAEVRRLLEVHGRLSKTAAQALGYKELIEHVHGRTTLDDAIATIVIRTRQFAVRQERWFRRDPRIVWLDIESNAVAESLPMLRDLAQR
jgi:tRNA dimethylallyltransferase